MASERSRQIASIKQAVPNVECVAADESQWQIRLMTYQNNQHVLLCTILVHFPPNFPSVPPRVILSCPMSHPWVDNLGNIVGHPQLRQWVTSHSLGPIISDIIREFSRCPPRATHGPVPHPLPAIQPYVAPYQGGPSYSQPPAPSASMQYRPVPTPGTDNIHSNPAPGVAAPRTPVPPCPSDFPQVDRLKEAEAVFYRDNQEALDDVIMEAAEVSSHMEMTTELLKNNIEVAKVNAALQAELAGLQRALEMKAAELEAAKKEASDAYRRQQEVISRYETSKLNAALQSEARDVDHESDALLERLKRGEVSYKDFKTDFMACRKKFHSLMATAEGIARRPPKP